MVHGIIAVMLASIDGRIQPADEAVIPITDEGLLRGDGAFEVIRLYDGVPFALDEHLERMGRTAAGIRLPLDTAAYEREVAALLAADPPGDAQVRLVATRGGRRLAIVEPLVRGPETLALRTVTYSPPRLLDDIKSLSYAANMLATRIAVERGGDEALLVTPHGRVLEGPRQTFVVSLDGATLVTAPLDDHVLDSITRRHLVALGLLIERPITADDLAGAHEAFLASTTREVHPVREIDGRALPAAPGPLTAAAATRLHARIMTAVGAP